jgi:hypothetical protein
MQQQTWVRAGVYSERISAEAALGLLARAGIPAYISSNEYVPGLGTNFVVLVPCDFERRARRILEEPAVSEQELTELATGLPNDAGKAP